MTNFFLILMIFLIVVANVIGFISYRKKKNLYSWAFAIFISAVLFGAIGGVLALLVIRDAFAIFYGFQIGQYLLINSVIVLFIAILMTVIRKYNRTT
ncbi:3-isopropylmalate dehydrogenase [Solibacillus sp. FSL W7-1324]|uniref:3-isopropylmalate dehydrogenase n=1 Tax=Solibacillus sp. FSL W7-1324 TaxID=2921701 RepID=UPI0030F4DCD0